MKRKPKSNRWKEIMAELFELPREVLLNLPRLILVGNRQLLVENHRGIIEYTEEVVRVGIKGGELIINGHNLQVQKLMAEELHLEGCIEKISYEE